MQRLAHQECQFVCILARRWDTNGTLERQTRKTGVIDFSSQMYVGFLFGVRVRSVLIYYHKILKVGMLVPLLNSTLFLSQNPLL